MPQGHLLAPSPSSREDVVSRARHGSVHSSREYPAGYARWTFLTVELYQMARGRGGALAIPYASCEYLYSIESNHDLLAETRGRGIEGCVFHFASSSVES